MLYIEPQQPIDLRTIPVDRWSEYEGHPVAFPPDIANYLSGIEQDRLSVDELDAIEARMDVYYNVTAPWTILIPSRTAIANRVAYLERE